MKTFVSTSWKSILKLGSRGTFSAVYECNLFVIRISPFLKRFLAVSKQRRERESKTARKMGRSRPPPSIIFWLLFQTLHGQNRKYRSSSSHGLSLLRNHTETLATQARLMGGNPREPTVEFVQSIVVIISYPDLPRPKETFQCKTEWDLGTRLSLLKTKQSGICYICYMLYVMEFWSLGRCFDLFVDKHKRAFSLVEKCRVTSWPCP